MSLLLLFLPKRRIAGISRNSVTLTVSQMDPITLSSNNKSITSLRPKSVVVALK